MTDENTYQETCPCDGPAHENEGQETCAESLEFACEEHNGICCDCADDC